MKKKLEKIVLSCLLAIEIFTQIAPSCYALKDEDGTNNQQIEIKSSKRNEELKEGEVIEFTYYTEDNTEDLIPLPLEQQLPIPQESDYTEQNRSGVRQRNAVTVVCKSAIKFIIKNKSASMKVIERVSGKTVANAFGKHYTKVCAGLSPLLNWTEIPYQAVYDATFTVLRNAGVSRQVAANIALAIKEGISWFI